MRWLRRRLAPTALVLLALTVFAGCGGSGGETTSGPLSEEQFLKRGTRICAQVFSKIRREYSKLIPTLVPQGGRQRDMEANVGTQRFVIPALRGLVRRLRALEAPPTVAVELKQALAALEEGIERGEEDARAVRGSRGVDFAFLDGYEMLWALGLTRCGLEN
ncbi:MAG TPA: hypothetical protein VFZ29_00625 [Solirubrobacterales bacterium]